MIWPELHIAENSQYAATLKFYMDDDSNEEYMVQVVDSVEDGMIALISNNIQYGNDNRELSIRL